jgi:sulfate adenylyltransferase subunit 2
MIWVRVIQGKKMNQLDQLESQSIYIMREAYAKFENLCMLWSMGKDSSVLLWLARKAFFGHVPFPVLHIDTTYKIPEMIAFRDQKAKEWGLDLKVSINQAALKKGDIFPTGKATRVECCTTLKKDALQQAMERYHYTAVFLGIRRDEEGTRAKERYFSPRDKNFEWDFKDQPPELWDQFKTDFAPGTHVRIHPLLDWTELNVWEYIERENIPVVSLYFDQGTGRRYRSLGCGPCTKPVESTARSVAEIIEELRSGKFANIAERSGRDQDKEDGHGLETLRRDGYM